MDCDSLPPVKYINLAHSFSNGKITLYILLILLFIILSGLFACIETGFSCVNKNRIYSKAEDGDKKAIRFKKALDRSEEYIVSILIFINIFHILCSILATALLIDLMGESGSIVSTIVITLIVFIFSETIPKNIANENADKVFENTMDLLTIVTYLVYPLVLLFALPYKLIIKNLDIEEESYSEEELSTIVDSIEEEGSLEEDESALIQSAMEFDDTKVKEIYTPISKVVSIDGNLKKDDFINRIMDEKKYSRLPVYKGNKTNIIGFVNVRSALKALLKNSSTNIKDLIFPLPSFKQNKKLDDILDMLIESKTHIALITNNEDKTIGIVTMDDVLNNLTEDMIKAGEENE